MQIILQRATDVLLCTIMVRSQDEGLRIRLMGLEIHNKQLCSGKIFFHKMKQLHYKPLFSDKPLHYFAFDECI